MKVSLLNHTPHALETLLLTKSTRLKMSSSSLEEVIAWPEEKKRAELKYMLGTIQSSWEFVDFIFLIEGVSRAFTHQLVRHRVGTSFAQQSQRTVDMSEFDYVTPSGIDDNIKMSLYDDTMEYINVSYKDMVDSGAKPEDARGILPTNICTNIIFKANLRTLHNMCGERLCVKAQGEFQQVVKALRDEVLKVCSWAEPMLRVHCAFSGVCCFPNVTNCKIKDETFNPLTGLRYDEATNVCGDNSPLQPLTKDAIQHLWEFYEGRLQK